MRLDLRRGRLSVSVCFLSRSVPATLLVHHIHIYMLHQAADTLTHCRAAQTEPAALALGQSADPLTCGRGALSVFSFAVLLQVLARHCDPFLLCYLLIFRLLTPWIANALHEMELDLHSKKEAALRRHTGKGRGSPRNRMQTRRRKRRRRRKRERGLRSVRRW